jgi:hypothetical protein
MMSDTYQYRKVKRVEYILQSGKIIMNLDGSKNDYISQADSIEFKEDSPDFRIIKRLRMGKEFVYLDFNEPITCNIKSGQYENVLLCDVGVEGKNPLLYVEKLPSLKDVFK